MMKNFRFLATVFVLTFVIGGMNLVSAANMKKFDLKADFLGDPKVTSAYEKLTYDQQKVKNIVTDGDRKVQIALMNQNETLINPYVWFEVKTGESTT